MLIIRYGCKNSVQVKAHPPHLEAGIVEKVIGKNVKESGYNLESRSIKSALRRLAISIFSWLVSITKSSTPPW